jgi:hypothetical protein
MDFKIVDFTTNGMTLYSENMKASRRCGILIGANIVRHSYNKRST